ncbi:MAG TPA: signal recognition particle receptor subunit alpha, partial [Solirubrobacteraceae bacterium]|nr:signal recognition particle receptor subunit alpha [Solirubrobacteraceae bacterium]
MARDWDELFPVAQKRRGTSAAPDEVDEAESAGPRGLARLRASLRATRQALGTGVGAGLRKTLADHDWEALEESLILADVGAPAAAEISQSLEATVRRERLDSDALRARLVELLAEQARGRDQDGQPLQATIDLRPQPTV